MQFGWGRFFPLSFLVQHSSRSGNNFRPTPSHFFACIGARNGYCDKLFGVSNENDDNSSVKTMLMMASTVDQDEKETSARESATTVSSVPELYSSSSTVTFHVVGDAYVDFFSFLDGDWPESGGDSRLGEPVKCYAGGSSVNTATHLKALITNFTAEPKPPVVLHTVLNPDDQYGQMLMDHATKHGIPVDNRKREGDSSTTGHCIAIVSGGERSFMTHQGVVENFTAEDLDVESIAATPTHLHLHLAGFYNIPGFWNGTLKKKLEAVRERRIEMFPDKNTTISLVTQHDATKEWDGGLGEIFPLLDFVLLNDLEARSIIRSERRRRRSEQQKQRQQYGNNKKVNTKRNGTSANDAGADLDFDFDFEHRFEHEHLEWADYFGALHPASMTIVTRGEKGSVALRGKKILSKQKPIVMSSIDPTGAGDSFTAGFLFGLWSWKLGGRKDLPSVPKTNNDTKAREVSNDNSKIVHGNDSKDAWPIEAIEEAMRWGVSLASAAVMIRGASVPPERSEIQKFLEQAKEPEYPPPAKTAVPN